MVGVVSVLGACGLPDDSGPRDIPPGFALDVDQSSTAPAAVPAASGPRVYFLRGNASEPGSLEGVSRDVRSNDLASLLQALLDGPTASEQSRGLRTAIPEGTQLLDVRVLNDGTARVNLDDAIFSATGQALIEAVAQIVFTVADGSSGARQLVLMVDGEVQAWRRGDGSTEEQPLTRFMYPALDPTSEPEFVPYPIGAAVGVPATTSTAAPSVGS
jgi:spore germination protein GerM